MVLPGSLQHSGERGKGFFISSFTFDLGKFQDKNMHQLACRGIFATSTRKCVFNHVILLPST
jgi:hypothetical protein